MLSEHSRKPKLSFKRFLRKRVQEFRGGMRKTFETMKEQDLSSPGVPEEAAIALAAVVNGQAALRTNGEPETHGKDASPRPVRLCLCRACLVLRPHVLARSHPLCP